MNNKELAELINSDYSCDYCVYCTYNKYGSNKYVGDVCYDGSGRCIDGILKWLESEVDLTEDEMFEELKEIDE